MELGRNSGLTKSRNKKIKKQKLVDFDLNDRVNREKEVSMGYALRRIHAVLRAANPAQENLRSARIVVAEDDEITLETFWQKPESDEFEIIRHKVEPRCLARLIEEKLVVQQYSQDDMAVFWFTADAFERLGK
jgi:hypothetical protein